MLRVTPPMLFEDAVGVTKLLDVVVLVLLIVVPPLNVPLIPRVVIPDTVPLLSVTPPIEFDVVDVVVMFPVMARVVSLNVRFVLPNRPVPPVATVSTLLHPVLPVMDTDPPPLPPDPGGPAGPVGPVMELPVNPVNPVGPITP